MSWNLSVFGEQLGRGSGIGELMDDLGRAIASGGDQVKMLGGGQPAHIPEMDALWRTRMLQMCETPGRLEHVLGNYEPPSGSLSFRTALAKLLKERLGWATGPENIVVTGGGQTAFFLLFNALAGMHRDGTSRKILLPLAPEYIGYANQSTSVEMFEAVKPCIELIDDHEFKYHVDFDALRVSDEIAAICVSRPTNPSGNVLTDQEMQRLASLAKQHAIPLIIDGAYGIPFPGAIFTEATPMWNEDIILTLSLSKLGLPGTRTGIVVARKEICDMIASMTSIVGLANPNIGQAIATPMLESGEILELSERVIRPFYEQKSRQAIEWVRETFDASIPYRVHRSEGAFFLWMWFDQLPITSSELYQRLKARGVLVVPGSHFFFGMPNEPWRHRDECIRVTFTMPEHVVREGLKVIAEEVTKAYRESPVGVS